MSTIDGNEVACCAGDVGFHKGRPLAAMVIFRCCLQWKAFQADRTSLFDKIINTMGSQVRLDRTGCSRCRAALHFLADRWPT